MAAGKYVARRCRIDVVNMMKLNPKREPCDRRWKRKIGRAEQRSLSWSPLRVRFTIASVDGVLEVKQH